jgi:hypothetical protein
MIDEDVRDLGVEGVLDAVETWHATQVEAEVRIFTAAAHFADLHHPDSRPDRAGRVLPGGERGIRLGGAGTPTVWEFAPAEFAARIGKSPYAGRALIADALDTRHRLPRLWARVGAGEVPVCYARHVAQQTRDLSVEGAALVDAGVAEYADGRITWSRFESLVAAKVVEADPDAAAERERAAAEEEFAKVGRTNAHGRKTLYVRSASAAIIRVDATITYLAHALAALGDTDTEDTRRAKALLVMANPVQAVQLLQAFAGHRAADNRGDAPAGADQDTLEDPDDQHTGNDNADETADASDGRSAGEASAQHGGLVAAFLKPFRPYQIGPDDRFACGFHPKRLLPRVVLYLHLYARTDTGEVGPVTRWEGEGPVTTAYLREVLGPACDFVIRPVIDLAGMAPVDAYEIPDRHREAVHLRTPADVFPFAANTSRHQQVDHTQPYVPPDHGGPPGQTGLANLGPMTGFHHRVKTHGAWQVKQPFPGVYLWRDPHGRTYLVDHTGTRKLGTTGSGTGLPDPAIDIVPPSPGVEFTYARTHVA